MKEKEYSTYGKEIIVDMWGVNSKLLNDLDYISNICIEAVKRAGATFVSIQTKKFEPQGLTVLILLEESHLTYHSYPEKQFAAINCYTCGTNTKPDKAIDFIIEQLKPNPNRVYRQTIIRGVE